VNEENKDGQKSINVDKFFEKWFFYNFNH
jgi:hypothetical protein